MIVQALKWVGDVDGFLELVDQRRLPAEFVKLQCRDIETLFDAIKTLAVRGAPAIGVAAAYGVVLGIQRLREGDKPQDALNVVVDTCEYLAASRPTAVNLFWALDRMQHKAESIASDNVAIDEFRKILLKEANAICREDVEMCRRIGQNGRRFIKEGAGILTHCNAGALATAGQGTALSVILEARKNARKFRVYADETRQQVQAVTHHLRQQISKAPGRPDFCLADFVAPKDTGIPDFLGAFAVTAGIGIEKLCAEFEADSDDYRSVLSKALADRLAEAFAERLHERIRKELWGYASTEAFTNQDLITEQYVGIRPAPGYPACPDHTEKATLFELLDVTNSIGISLTETFAMHPGASVSGWYFSHPQSSYYGLGKIGRDQVADYAKRKQMEVAEVELWLAPNLGYDPKS